MPDHLPRAASLRIALSKAGSAAKLLSWTFFFSKSFNYFISSLLFPANRFRQ